MLLQIFRWIYGYASFKIIGGFSEKFINHTKNKEINLWDLKKSGDVLYAKILASDYKLLRKSAKVSSSKLKLTRKYGFPFFLAKYKKRFGIPAGMIMFLVILSFFSLYVWRVNIEGNEILSTDEIVAVMKDLGVHAGAFKSNINCAAVKQEAMGRLTDVAWMCVNMKGSNVNVFVKEKVHSPETVSDGEPCNIVASREGQIERVETYKGEICVNSGDAVTPGRVLISGITELSEGQVSFVDADGKIFAKTQYCFIEKVKLNQLSAVDSGKVTKRINLKFADKEFCLNPWVNFSEPYRLEEEHRGISLPGLQIPFAIHKEICYNQKCEEKNLDISEAEKIASDAISQREKNEMGEKEILSRDVKTYEENGEYFVEVIVWCIENIGKKEKICFK